MIAECSSLVRLKSIHCLQMGFVPVESGEGTVSGSRSKGLGALDMGGGSW
jgi:hypothetical protein